MRLSRNQRTELVGLLDARHARLLEHVRDALEQSENQQYIELIDRSPADIGDESVGDALADLNLALIDRHVREMREIDATRARMGERGFGSCIDCDGEIGFARLKAYPTAQRCIVCQEQHERTYAGEGVPTL